MTHTEPGVPATQTLLRLSDPSSLLAGLPFLVGFHPEQSFVILVLQESRVKVTARVALNTPTATLAAKFTDICAQHEGDALLLIAYAEDEPTGRAALADLLDELGPVPVSEAIIADGSRWWSALCDGPCCPAEGTPYDLVSHQVTAEAVLAGSAPLANRNALAETVEGPNGADRVVAEAVFEEALLEIAELEFQERSDLMALMVEDYCVHERPLTPRECAELAVLAYDVHVRDIAAERIRPRDATTHVELWRQVVRHTVEPFECAPLCLVALAAWVSGRGALQVVCMERVEQINPDYSLLHVLEEINTRCLPPSVWGEIRGTDR
jgi:hypothetical protein